MKFTITAIVASLAAVSSVSAFPTAVKRATSDATTYAIKSFTERKLDGMNINNVFFNISATNGGTLDFQCSNYDPVTGTTGQNFAPGKVYFCGNNSFFSFSYLPHDAQSTNTNNTLYLWQDIDVNNTIGGKVSFQDPYCRAGGSSVNDLICSIPPQVGALNITLDKLGASSDECSS